MEKKKVVVAITGPSGSIYAKISLQQLEALKNQISEVGVIMSDNAKDVWRYELEDDSFQNFNFKFYSKIDFMAKPMGMILLNNFIVVRC